MLHIYLAGLIPGNEMQMIDAANQANSLGYSTYISPITVDSGDTIDLMQESYGVLKQCDAVIFLTNDHPSIHGEMAMAKGIGRMSIFFSLETFLAHHDFLIGMKEADQIVMNMDAMPSEVSPDMPQEVVDVMNSQSYANTWCTSFFCPRCGTSIAIERSTP